MNKNESKERLIGKKMRNENIDEMNSNDYFQIKYSDVNLETTFFEFLFYIKMPLLLDTFLLQNYQKTQLVNFIKF